MKNKQEELQEKADFIRDSLREDGHTYEEYNDAMEEMECWSVDNHLETCDKHSKKAIDNAVEEERSKVGQEIKKFLNKHWWQDPDIGTKYTSQRVIFDWIDNHLKLKEL